jgi:DNA invertase Pin-like site-specific DNA recombinase
MEVVYIRCSTPDQEPQLQLNDINLELKPVNDALILEESISAWKENTPRPQFIRLEQLIRQHKVKTIYVWNLDRIYRNRKKLVAFFALCKIHKVKVRSYCQKWLDGLYHTPEPFDEILMDFFINLLGWIAESESSDKSSRIKMATRKKNNTTYSYKGNLWGRKPFPTNTINRVIELHQSGLSIRQIAKNVTVYDKNNNGRDISKSAVHKILCHNSTKNVS